MHNETAEAAVHTGPHISIKPETLTHLFGFPVTNSYITSIIVIVLFIIIGIIYSQQINKQHKSGFFYTIHFLLKTLHTFFATLVGHTNADAFFPLFSGLFIYILLQNWFGLLPGVGSIMVKITDHGEEIMAPLLRGSTADLNTTLALALVSFAAIQYLGVKHLGLKTYVSKFLNFTNPLNFVIGLFELISEFSRVISFSFRLFGNIFAGEVMLAIIAFLVPVLVPFPFLIMEIFVGVLQAFVFAMLTAVFVNLAISHH